MKELRLLLISIFLVFSGNVFSQTEDFKEMTGKEKTAFINQMQLVSKETTSLQCNFIQKRNVNAKRPFACNGNNVLCSD